MNMFCLAGPDNCLVIKNSRSSCNDAFLSLDDFSMAVVA